MTSSIQTLGARRFEGPSLQAVLLDMDGTLVDTEGFWWDAEVEVFARLGHVLRDEWRQVVVGGPMSRSAGFLIEATTADITLEELTGLLNATFIERLRRGVPLMPGARRLLTCPWQPWSRPSRQVNAWPPSVPPAHPVAHRPGSSDSMIRSLSWWLMTSPPSSNRSVLA